MASALSPRYARAVTDLNPLRTRVAALAKAAPAEYRKFPGGFVCLRPEPLGDAFLDALDALGGPVDRTHLSDGIKASGSGHMGPDWAVLAADGRAVLSLGSAYWHDADQTDLHLVLAHDTLVSIRSVDACSQSMLPLTGYGDPARVKQALDMVGAALEWHLAPLRETA